MGKRYWIIILLGTILSTAPFTSKGQTGTITGRVVEDGTGSSLIGANIYLADKNNARIQLNYVLASGDTDGADKYDGVATGYTDDIFLAQFQVGF